MSPYDWQKVVHRIRATWGRSASDAWDKAELLYRQNRRIQNTPLEQVMAAVTEFELRGGAWPPKIPEVLAKASGPLAGEVSRVDGGSCGHERTAVMGHVEVCVLCLSEWDVETAEDQEETV